MSDHPPRPTRLDSYELEEVEVPIGEGRRSIRAIKITIHGKNIFLRAEEPIVRIGETDVLYPRIEPDEQTVVGYVTGQPQEGATITMEYLGLPPVALPERFTMAKLEPRSSTQ